MLGFMSTILSLNQIYSTLNNYNLELNEITKLSFVLGNECNKDT